MGIRHTAKGMIAILIIMATVISCSQPEKQQSAATGPGSPLTIAVASSPLSLPLYIARAKDYFSEQGISVRFLEMTSGRQCLEAVFTGDADVATVADVPIVLSSFSRKDYAVFATLTYMHNSMKIAALRSSHISSPSGLAGKRIGIVPGTSSQFFLDILLKRNGLRNDEVDVRYMSPDEMLPALQKNEVDAVSIWEPHFFVIKESFGRGLVVLNQNAAVYRRTFNLVALNDVIGKKRKTIEGMLHALDKAENHILRNREDSQKIVAAELGQGEEFIRWVWDDFEVSLSLDQELLLILEELARSAMYYGYVEQREMPNYLEFIEVGPLRDVLPENITIIGK